MHWCLQAFSLQNTTQGVLSTTSSSSSTSPSSSPDPVGSYASVNGVRILSLLWIICGHTTQLSAWNNLGERPPRRPGGLVGQSVVRC